MRARVCKRQVLYRGRIITLVREELELRGRRLRRDKIEHPGAVVIAPILGRSRIVFVRQYRHALNGELLELPAGTLSRGEGEAACARRELIEETGWQAGRLRRIGRFWTAPGFTNERITLFLAQDLRYVGARPDEDEFVEPVVMSLRTALAKIRSGAINDSKSVIGVLLAQRFLS